MQLSRQRLPISLLTRWKIRVKYNPFSFSYQQKIYTTVFLSLFENGTDTNPEELIAAAHAACFSMALSHQLSEKGFEPQEVTTEAQVNIDKNDMGFFISEIHLSTTAQIKGIDEKTFLEIAEGSKVNCPVSKALAVASISLDAKLFL